MNVSKYITHHLLQMIIHGLRETQFLAFPNELETHGFLLGNTAFSLHTDRERVDSEQHSVGGELRGKDYRKLESLLAGSHI